MYRKGHVALSFYYILGMKDILGKLNELRENLVRTETQESLLYRWKEGENVRDRLMVFNSDLIEKYSIYGLNEDEKQDLVLYLLESIDHSLELLKESNFEIDFRKTLRKQFKSRALSILESPCYRKISIDLVQEYSSEQLENTKFPNEDYVKRTLCNIASYVFNRKGLSKIESSRYIIVEIPIDLKSNPIFRNRIRYIFNNTPEELVKKILLVFISDSKIDKNIEDFCGFDSYCRQGFLKDNRIKARIQNIKEIYKEYSDCFVFMREYMKSFEVTAELEKVKGIVKK
jgi:hypothetical protein